MGKPLISDAAMRGMYEAMQRMRIAKRDPAVLSGCTRTQRIVLQDEPESLLAALLSQVRRRDNLLTHGNNPLLPAALAACFTADAAPKVHTCAGTAEECAAVAVGMALRAADRLRSANMPAATGDQPPRTVVLAILNEFPALKGALQLIEQHDLPVLLIVGGDVESRADAQRRLQSTKVPVMPVDRTDAVAICRVTQECMLRARNGWGGAVMHAASMPGSADPLLLLRQHLENRSLLSTGFTPS